MAVVSDSLSRNSHILSFPKQSDRNTDEMAAMSDSLSLEMPTFFISEMKRRRH
jgi:hypothetical protein